MIILRQKQFSIESGHPDKKGSLGRELANTAKTGAATGAIMSGLLIGAPFGLSGLAVGGAEGKILAKWGLIGTAAGTAILTGMCMCSAIGAKNKALKATRASMSDVMESLYSMAYDKESVFNVKELRRYIVEDGDPSKYVITFAIDSEKGKGIIYLNKPTKPIIAWLNKDLEDMIAYNRYADYSSMKTKDGYIVEVSMPSIEQFAIIIWGFIKEFGSDYKVSCITEGTWNKANKLTKKLEKK